MEGGELQARGVAEGVLLIKRIITRRVAGSDWLGSDWLGSEWLGSDWLGSGWPDLPRVGWASIGLA